MKYKKASNPLSLITPFCVHLPIAQGHEHLVNKDTSPWKSLRHWPVEHNPFLGVPHCNSWDYLGFHKIEKRENNTVRTSEDPLLTKGCTFCFVWMLQHTHKKPRLFSLCTGDHFALKAWVLVACTTIGLTRVLPSPVFVTAHYEAPLVISQMGRAQDHNSLVVSNG